MRALLALVVVLAAACGPGARPDACNSDEDCRVRESCVDGECVERTAREDDDAGARADAGTSADGGVVPVDAGGADAGAPDAGPFDGGGPLDDGGADEDGGASDGGADDDAGALVDAGGADAGSGGLDGGAPDGGLLVDGGLWFDDAYASRVAIRVDAAVATSSVTGAVVLVRVPARRLVDPSAVAFVADDHQTALAFERASGAAAPTNLYWVRLGTVAAGDADHRVWLYFGGDAETAPLDPWSDTSLVLHFEPGAPLVDDSPQAHAVAALGSVEFEAGGRAGGFLSTKNVADAGGLSIGDDPSLDRSQSFTASALVSSNAEPTPFRNVMLKGDAPAYDWALEATSNDDGRFSFTVRDAADANHFSSSDVQGGFTSREAHVAAVREPSGATKLYVDGRPSGTHAAPVLLRDTSGPLRVGHVNGFDEQWRGWLDELVVAQVARSDAWIALHARSILGVATMIELAIVLDDAFDDATPATGGAIGDGFDVIGEAGMLTEAGGALLATRATDTAFAWAGVETLGAFDPGAEEALVAQWTIGGFVVPDGVTGSDLVFEAWVRPENLLTSPTLWYNDDGGVFLRIYLGEGEVPFAFVTTTTDAKPAMSNQGTGVVDHAVILFQDGAFAQTWDGTAPMTVTMRVDGSGWRVAFSVTTRGELAGTAGSLDEDGVVDELDGPLRAGCMAQQYDTATAALRVERARVFLDER